MPSSPFLAFPTTSWVASNELAFAVRDGFPVTPGHTLVITRRVVATWFDATADEQRAVLDLVEVVKRQLDATSPKPDGYNVGFNVGEVAGQTVMHLHVHVIPRYRGDMDDPRGGVRHVIPWKGNYRREAAAPLATGGDPDPFYGHLRPLFAGATIVDIVAAFVQDSGLELLQSAVFSVVERGGRVRLVTGDYLAITQAEALKRLLDWEGAQQATGGEAGFQARVVETDRLPGRSRSFHPKSWRFEGPGFGAAFVGSSNVSHSALASGIEWNLRVDRHESPVAFERTRAAFEAIWASARPLDLAWVSAYAERARITAHPLPPGDSEAEPFVAAPPPHAIQLEALAALRETREAGRTRALVVMATGLGKTLLAALDADAYRSERHVERPRVLFLAHRRELLSQASTTFRRVLRPSFPGLRVGWFAEDRGELDADLVVASVQKLSRPENLDLLAARRFDYVVVDEVHHADAPSYRKILARLEPGFLLGLTATPDRADEGDVLGLFDDNLPYRADLGVGIEHGKLAPFAYFGLKDQVDYADIPWRSGRFDPAVLGAKVQTQQRMEQLWRAWGEHAGSRTLVFCCSIAHAVFVRDWLVERGVRAVAVFSEPGSADRDEALRDLAGGGLQAVCAVDLFNEGVDVPSVDRVVMLRPTESPVLFLQQLGRGLRVAEGKDHLTVIDFVGNHRVFLDRVRTLLSFASKPTTLHAFLDLREEPELPPGCSVAIELEAIDLLKRLLPAGRSEVERAYREIHASRGTRPTLGELYRMGYTPSTLRGAHGSWFGFVASEGHASTAEQAVLASAGEWLRELETTQMTKCFKMVLLEALIEAESLTRGLPLDDLARRSHAVLARSPELFRDLEGVKELPNPRAPDPSAWVAYWRKNPVAAWCGDAGKPGRWFRIEGERLVPRFPVPDGDVTTFVEMTRELVDYRLAQYRRRLVVAESGAAFDCKVTWNQRDPIVKLPSLSARPDRPDGETDVRLPDGRVWRFRFMKEYCNVAHAPGSARNELPDLLRRWFGPGAGRPGTSFNVRFSRSPDGWWVEPMGQVIELPRRGSVIAFPTLRAAAGMAQGQTVEAVEAEEVTLPVRAKGDDLFAVRATGESMDGGSDPIRDGDWLVFRQARGAGLGSLTGRVALVQIESEQGDHGFQVKRIVNQDGRWLLRSDNPAQPSYDTNAETVPIAVLVEHVSPEQLAPPVGTVLDITALEKEFAITGTPRTGRVGGHLFVVVDKPGALVQPDRARIHVSGRRPGETSFVLAPAGEGAHWRYCGVGRWNDEDAAWGIPAVDYETWRLLGAGRECSRRLPPDAEARARAIVDDLLAKAGEGAWLDSQGKRFRIASRAQGGGLRIDGGPGGFGERSVSLTDIAWALAARDDVAQSGGLADEARVNRLRYLEGTPKSSTRWIDTGWALAIVAAAIEPRA